MTLNARKPKAPKCAVCRAAVDLQYDFVDDRWSCRLPRECSKRAAKQKRLKKS